jgi:hypothetical protein
VGVATNGSGVPYGRGLGVGNCSTATVGCKGTVVGR